MRAHEIQLRLRAARVARRPRLGALDEVAERARVGAAAALEGVDQAAADVSADAEQDQTAPEQDREGHVHDLHQSLALAL
jgi:hypothetical protein